MTLRHCDWCQGGKTENHLLSSESRGDRFASGEGKSSSLGAPSTSRRWQSRLPWIAALILVMLACHFSNMIAYFPQAGGDEQNLLSFDYYYSNLGSRVDLTWISESYNQRGLPKLPAPWVSWLRSLYSRIIGCSSFSERMFSVAMILGSILITTIASPVHHRLAPWGILVLLLAGGLSPSLYFAARTIRFEQEILFIGCLSCFLLPCLLQRRQSSRLNLLVWSVSGCLSGYAGACHPCGYVFMMVQLASLLVLRHAWRDIDGLSMGTRMLSWLSGLMVPVAMQIALYAIDWPNWNAYLTDTALRFTEVKKSLVDNWAPLWPYQLGSSPRWLAATLYAFKLTAISPYMTYKGSPLLVFLFVSQAVVCLGASVVWLVRYRRCDSKYLPAVSTLWLAGGFVLCHFAYAILLSPNYTCYPYLGLFVPVGFSWIMIQTALWLKKRSSALWRSWIPLIAASACILLGFNFAQYQNRWLASEYAKGKLASFDDHIEAMAQVGEKTGWADERTPVYFDNYTWRAAGPNWKSLFEVSFNEKAPRASPTDRVAFSDILFNQVFNYPNWGKQLTPSQRLERIRHLLRDRTLSALIFGKGDEYHFWEPTLSGYERPLWVGRIIGPGRISWARAKPPGFPLEGKQGKMRRDRLAKGWYIMLMKGSFSEVTCFRMILANEDSRELHDERSFCNGPIHAEVPKALLIDIKYPLAQVAIESASSSLLPQGIQVQMLPLSAWSHD